MNLLKVSDDVESVRECARTIRTAEVVNSSAFMSHMSHEGMFYLVPKLVDS